MIRRAVCNLFRKKSKPADGHFTEQLKTLYNVELLKNAQAIDQSQMFPVQHFNQPHGGVEVSFRRYTNLAKDEGRLLEVPCKIGTQFHWGKTENVWTVTGYYFSSDEKLVYVEKNDMIRIMSIAGLADVLSRAPAEEVHTDA